MVRQADVILHLMEPGAVNRRQRVFLRIEHTLAQRAVEFRQGQRRRLCPVFRKDLSAQIIGNTELQTRQIGRHLDPLVGGDIATAPAPDARNLDIVGRLHRLRCFLPDRAAPDCETVIFVPIHIFGFEALILRCGVLQDDG